MDSPQQKFFVSDDGKEKLSITKAELQAGINSGKHTDKTLAWTKGMNGWIPLSDPSWEKHGIVLEPEPPELPNPVQEENPELPSTPTPVLAPTPSPPNPNVSNPNSRTEGNPPKISGIAIASLVCGLLLLPIISIVLGHIARSQIKKSKGTVYGKGIALAGLTLGYLPLIAALAFGIFTLFWFLSPDSISEEPWMESKEIIPGDYDSLVTAHHGKAFDPIPEEIRRMIPNGTVLYFDSGKSISLDPPIPSNNKWVIMTDVLPLRERIMVEENPQEASSYSYYHADSISLTLAFGVSEQQLKEALNEERYRIMFARGRNCILQAADTSPSGIRSSLAEFSNADRLVESVRLLPWKP